ncbi:MAG TPA: hypothetical protein VER96_24275 [Polyangiaceae bacterium]|nr:hypothetical protein [Polyangiaceae bacterium]
MIRSTLRPPRARWLALALCSALLVGCGGAAGNGLGQGTSGSSNGAGAGSSGSSAAGGSGASGGGRSVAGGGSTGGNSASAGASSGASGGSSGAGANGGTNSAAGSGAGIDLRDPAEDLGPTLRGVLFNSESPAYGVYSTSTLQKPQYYFAADGRIFTLFFSASSETDGLSFIKDYTVRLPNGDLVMYDATYQNPDTASAWGLSKDAYVATLEVNGGQGSDGRAEFVVTRVTIDDGSTKIPMAPLDALADAKSKFDLALAAKKASIDSMMADARAATQPPQGTVFSGGPDTHFWPDWTNANESLTANYRYTQREYWQKQIGQTAGTAGTPPMPIYETHNYYVEYTATYSYDASGKLTNSVDAGPTLQK